MIDALLAAVAREVTRHPRRVVASLVVVTAAAVLLVPRFRIDPDVASILPADHPAVSLLRALGDDSSRTLFLLLRGERVAERLPEAVRRLRGSELLARVDATWAELAGTRARLLREAPLYYLDEAALDALRARLTGDGRAAAVAESLERLATDPLAGADLVRADPLGLRWALDARAVTPPGFDPETPYLVLAGGRLALVRVVGVEAPFDVEFSRALLADVDARLAGLFDEPVGTLGGYRNASRDAARIRGDLVSSLSVSVPLIVLFLVVSTRSFVLPHLYLLPVSIAVVWAIGFGGALLGPLTPLAVSAAAILIGLGADFAIHYAGRLHEELERGAEHDAAVLRANVTTGRAVLAGTATTVAAFLSFSFGSFPGLFGFGVLLSLGLGFAALAALLVLPIAIRRAPPRRETTGLLVRGTEALARSRAGRPVAFAVLALAAAGWGFALTHDLVFDADPKFMRPEAENRAALELGEELGFSPLPLLVLTRAGAPGTMDGVDGGDGVAEVARAVERLRAGGDVRFAEGPHALVPGPERRERVEALRRDVAGWVEDALADFDEAGFDPEALRPALEGQAARLEADPELEPTELDTLQVEWRGERWWKTSLYASGALSDRTYREALRGAVDEAFDVRHEVVDPYGIADELGPLLATDLLRALVVCGVLVVVFVLLWMGDVALGLVALVPVAAGLGISLGGLAFLGVPLHPGNFVAVPLILGLGVDDGIHLALRHREGGSTGVTLHAIWRTSATTALGFGSLVTAQSPALASLGGIVLAGVLVCFAASALVLPPLLRRR